MAEAVVEYWQKLHKELRPKTGASPSGNLQIVCCTGLSGAYNQLVHHFQQYSLKRAFAHLGKLEGKKILEVGCGTGRWVKLLSGYSTDICGVDISQESITVNKSLYPKVEFHRMDAQALGFADGKFDLILSVTVLQHLSYSEKEKAIHEVTRCLKPGGYLVLMEQIRPIGLDREEYSGTITFPYTVSEWQDSFSRCGCEHILSERVLFLPLVLNLFLPAKRALGKLLKRREGPAGKPQRQAQFDRRLNYVVTLVLVPFSLILEYVFIWILRAPRWTKQDIFGRHQTFVFRKAQ